MGNILFQGSKTRNLGYGIGRRAKMKPSTTIQRAFLLVLIPIFCQVAFAQDQGKRVALVIGNSAYSSGSLKNPVNDAQDMAQALKDIGFTVSLGTDTTKKAMYQLIEQFGASIRGADIALFYYSGHGIQANGENYLIPIGADIDIASDVEIEGVQLQRLMGRMEAGGAGTNIVILDACRNNPFPNASRGMEKGLAVVGTKPPESIIIYATEAGATADDGSGRNGVFTSALLKNLKRSEEFTVVLRDVNAEVRKETNQKQTPAKYDNLTRGVYLAGLASSAVMARQSEPVIKAEPKIEKVPTFLREGIQVDNDTLKHAIDLYQQGWRYNMPLPKSPQAAWGNKDRRTTWFYGFWHNVNTDQYSETEPKPDEKGQYLGDTKNDSHYYRRGGSPQYPTKIEWLLSKNGGILPQLESN
jgi:Caspase domain